MTTGADSSDALVLGDVAPSDVRVRFSPSPTGDPHVGLVRTALFNWAFARHYGGTFVLRIEDTDEARDSEESYAAILETLQWLGLSWDEGPDAGGPHGPYRQSQRNEIYLDVTAKLMAAGRAYYCYCSKEELDARREAARAAGKPSGYDGHCRLLSDEQVAAYRAEGREPAIRFRMPDESVTFVDLISGENTVDAANLDDFVVVRPNGKPLYQLTNPIDDALMGITHILRGADLRSSTQKQLVLHRALRELGVADAPMPKYAHLPLIVTAGGRKLSKRDPESSMQLYRDRGFLPEGLLNYLALLGWSLGGDVEVFSLDEMTAVFDVTSVNVNPARFDLQKALAINGDWIRRLPADDLAVRVVPYLQSAGYLDDPVPDADHDLLRAATPLVQERMTALDESAGMLGFLFSGDEVAYDEDSVAKVLNADARPVLEATVKALAELPDLSDDGWNHEAIQASLRATLVDGLGLKPKHAFGPVRVAVTGRRVSPPLFESMELLGRQRSLARLDAALGLVAE